MRKIQDWAKMYFVLSLLLLSFLFGAMIGIYKIFPYSFLSNGSRAIIDFLYNWKTYTIRPQSNFLKKNDFGGTGVIVYDPDRACHGVTLYSGLKNDRLALYLIDMEGNLLHQWTVSFNEIWPKAKHLDSQPGDLYQQITGSMLMKNGDVILNIYRVGLVKLDRFSNVVWKVPIRAHHQFNPSLRDSLWVPCEDGADRRYPEKAKKRGSLELDIHNPEAVCEVSFDGKLLRKIDVVEAFFRSGLGPMLLSVGLKEDKNYHFYSDGDSFTHLNDIEVVTKDVADAFPIFKAGDLLLSLATQSLLAVMDPDTETIKWTMRGPFFMQHDPDILPNGKILLFDNLGASLDPREYNGSRILEIDPATAKVQTVYGSSSKNFFCSQTEGDQQLLENGNLMIVESVRGRIFEIDPSGEIVWCYVTRWDDDEVIITHEATRYPESYADFTKKSQP